LKKKFPFEARGGKRFMKKNNAKPYENAAAIIDGRRMCLIHRDREIISSFMSQKAQGRAGCRIANSTDECMAMHGFPV